MSKLKLIPVRQPLVLWKPVVINFPQTTTLLALSLMGGVLMFTPMVATIGDHVPPYFREEVIKISEAVRSALLLVIGFYFAKVVNAGQESMANRAMDVAEKSVPQQFPAPASAQVAADQVATAAQKRADEINETDFERNRDATQG